MTPIKEVIKHLLDDLNLHYKESIDDCFDMEIDGLFMRCEIQENIRVFKFYGFNGIVIPQYRRNECLEFLNMLTFQWDSISFFLTRDNRYVVCSSGCAVGYELTPEKARSYFAGMFQKMMDDDINQALIQVGR